MPSFMGNAVRVAVCGEDAATMVTRPPLVHDMPSPQRARACADADTDADASTNSASSTSTSPCSEQEFDMDADTAVATGVPWDEARVDSDGGNVPKAVEDETEAEAEAAYKNSCGGGEEYRLARVGAPPLYVRLPWPAAIETHAEVEARMCVLLEAAARGGYVKREHGAWLLPQHGPLVHSAPDASGTRVWRAYTTATAAVDALLAARQLEQVEAAFAWHCSGMPHVVQVPYSVASAVVARLRGTGPPVPHAAWRAARESAAASWADALADGDTVSAMLRAMDAASDNDPLAWAVAATRVVATAWQSAQRAASLLWW